MHKNGLKSFLKENSFKDEIGTFMPIHFYEIFVLQHLYIMKVSPKTYAVKYAPSKLSSTHCAYALLSTYF